MCDGSRGALAAAAHPGMAGGVDGDGLWERRLPFTAVPGVIHGALLPRVHAGGPSHIVCLRAATRREVRLVKMFLLSSECLGLCCIVAASEASGHSEFLSVDG